MRARWIVVIALFAVGVIIAAALGVGAFLAAPASTEAGQNEPSSAADSGAPTEEDDDFGTVEVYTVNSDGTLDPEASGLTAEIWDTFIRVATLDVVSKVMTQYRVGDAPDSDTLAYVYQDDDPSRWILAANLATSENHNDLVATLVHEYAHILTLGQDEVTGDYSSCDTIVLDEGCADADSAILGFEEQFWAPYGDSAPALNNADADVAYDFYLAHEDDFVSDYAATNAVEDIAESFMTWVVEDDPTGTSVVAQKFAFFDAYPTLVAVRERIRAEFADDLGLSV
ncbi:MAG: NADH:ubiquinone oxidoreductase subunit 4 (chain M) [Salinibacterium sp.]|nr:NADH:ubiquinone oxidoreductase subunit 4 (chain M) [Salinibacterium sp.]